MEMEMAETKTSKEVHLMPRAQNDTSTETDTTSLLARDALGVSRKSSVRTIIRRVKSEGGGDQLQNGVCRLQAAARAKFARRRVARIRAKLRTLQKFRHAARLGLYSVPPQPVLQRLQSVHSVQDFLSVETAIEEEGRYRQQARQRDKDDDDPSSGGGRLRTASMAAMDDPTPNKKAMSTLQVAAMHGNVYLMRFLIDERDVNINAVDNGGWTALMQAVFGDHDEAVEYLIEAGADLSIRNNAPNYDGKTDGQGDSALDIAVNERKPRTLHCLLGSGRLANGAWNGNRVCRSQLFRPDPESGTLPILAALLRNFPDTGLLVLNSYTVCGQLRKGYDGGGDMMGFHGVGELYGDPSASASAMPLSVLLQAKTRQRIFQHPVVKNLVDVKWQSFGRQCFIRECSLHFTLVVLYTIGFVAYSPRFGAYRLPWRTGGEDDVFAHVSAAYVFLLIMRLLVWACFLWRAIQECREFCRMGWGPKVTIPLPCSKEKKKSFRLYAYFTQASNITDIILLLLVFGNVYSAHQIPCGLAGLLLWWKSLNYIGNIGNEVGYGDMGVFVNMIDRMFADVAKFGVVLLIFIFMFFCVFYPLLEGKDSYEDFLSTMLTLFRAMLVDFDFSIVFAPSRETGRILDFTYSEYADSVYLAFMFILYLVITAILLFNMLIAMMANTFDDMYEAAESETRQMRAEDLVRWECTLSAAERRRCYLLVRQQDDRLHAAILPEVAGSGDERGCLGPSRVRCRPPLHTFHVGDRVKAIKSKATEMWYDATVDQVLKDGSVRVKYAQTKSGYNQAAPGGSRKQTSSATDKEASDRDTALFRKQMLPFNEHL
eukprot:g2046.t1